MSGAYPGFSLHHLLANLRPSKTSISASSPPWKDPLPLWLGRLELNIGCAESTRLLLTG